jgi:hypothetical protein
MTCYRCGATYSGSLTPCPDCRTIEALDKTAARISEDNRRSEERRTLERERHEWNRIAQQSAAAFEAAAEEQFRHFAERIANLPPELAQEEIRKATEQIETAQRQREAVQREAHRRRQGDNAWICFVLLVLIPFPAAVHFSAPLRRYLASPSQLAPPYDYIGRFYQITAQGTHNAMISLWDAIDGWIHRLVPRPNLGLVITILASLILAWLVHSMGRRLFRQTGHALTIAAYLPLTLGVLWYGLSIIGKWVLRP